MGLSSWATGSKQEVMCKQLCAAIDKCGWLQVNISTPEDGWHEEWTSDDFMALPELVSVAYENQEYNPKLQYLTGVARDDASYLLCEYLIFSCAGKWLSW